MDPTQKEAMAVAMELKLLVSLRLCNEIPREQYELRRERLLSDFDILSRRMTRCDELEAVF